MAHDCVWGDRPLSVVHRAGRAGAGQKGALPAPSRNIVTSPYFQVLVRRVQEVERRMQLGYPSRGRGRCLVQVGATSIQRRVPRTCSRAWALLWREVPDPSPVNRSASPIDRDKPLWLDVCHSIQYP